MRVSGHWKAGSLASVWFTDAADGCTRSESLVILSSMRVCEGCSSGESVVTKGLLADGWSLVGATPLVVGRAGKWEALYDREEMD